MSKMTLTKALKEKNRLIKEINKYKELIIRSNVQESRNPRKFDVQELSSNLSKAIDNLVTLKAGIAKANVLIYEEMFKIAEYKSHINFLKTIPIKDGIEIVPSYGASNIENKYNSVITEVEKEGLIKQFEDTIGDLQDKIDAHNATSYIEI